MSSTESSPRPLAEVAHDSRVVRVVAAMRARSNATDTPCPPPASVSRRTRRFLGGREAAYCDRPGPHRVLVGCGPRTNGSIPAACRVRQPLEIRRRIERLQRQPSGVRQASDRAIRARDFAAASPQAPVLARRSAIGHGHSHLRRGSGGAPSLRSARGSESRGSRSVVVLRRTPHVRRGRVRFSASRSPISRRDERVRTESRLELERRLASTAAPYSMQPSARTFGRWRETPQDRSRILVLR